MIIMSSLVTLYADKVPLFQQNDKLFNFSYIEKKKTFNHSFSMLTIDKRLMRYVKFTFVELFELEIPLYDNS